MSEVKTSSALNVLLKQAQTIITLLYLIMVGTGMLYYDRKYSEFDINIFQYADIFYFLVAPFEDGFILLLSSIVVLLFAFAYKADGVLARKFPRMYSASNFGMDKKPWFKRMQVAVWMITVSLVLVYYAHLYGNRAKRLILESEPVTISYAENEEVTGKMIGKTDDTLFLLTGTEVKAIPLTSLVKEIVITNSFSHEQD